MATMPTKIAELWVNIAGEPKRVMRKYFTKKPQITCEYNINHRLYLRAINANMRSIAVSVGKVKT